MLLDRCVITVDDERQHGQRRRRAMGPTRLLPSAHILHGGGNRVTEPHLVQTPGGVALLAPAKTRAFGKLCGRELGTLVCGFAAQAGEQLLMWLGSGRRSRALSPGGHCVARTLCWALCWAPRAWRHIVRQCFRVVHGMHDLLDVCASRRVDI